MPKDRTSHREQLGPEKSVSRGRRGRRETMMIEEGSREREGATWTTRVDGDGDDVTIVFLPLVSIRSTFFKVNVRRCLPLHLPGE